MHGMGESPPVGGHIMSAGVGEVCVAGAGGERED